MCSVIFGVSQRAGDLILGLVRLIIQLVSRKPDGSMDPLQTHILNQVPGSIEAALSRFNSTDSTTAYAVCPVCHCTFPPSAGPGNSRYPERCTNRPKPEEGPCDEPLLEDAAQDLPVERDRRPRRIFLYHHFADHLAGLLSQHEAEMDKSCNESVESMQRPPLTFVKDFFDAEFISTFEGPIPGTLFVQRPGTEGRYLFALNVDFFNVEGMRVRGANTSCGLISLACLNLPIEIRYLPENMYVIIIPGPAEPSLTQLNHYLRPLINDMVGAWEQGIYVSRTPKYSTGRTTRSAIALSVNDLPAARQTASLASHSSHFYCSRCECYHLSTRGATNFDQWKTRNPRVMRRQAEAWRDADSSVEQAKLFQANGIRWSELWRLSYWDPTRQLVVDSMHCILEGLAKYHSKTVLGLTSATAATKLDVPPPFSHNFQEPAPDAINDRDRQQVKQIHSLLLTPIEGGDLVDDIEENLNRLSGKLHRRNVAALRFVVEDLGVTIQPDPDEPVGVIRKRNYVAALVQWVSIPSLLVNTCGDECLYRGRVCHLRLRSNPSKLRRLWFSSALGKSSKTRLHPHG